MASSEPQKDSDRAISEFIAITAHKFRTPISTIRWQAELLLSGDLGELTEHQREALSSVAEAAERLSDLSHALLYVFELEQDLPVTHPQETEFAQLLAKVQRNLSALAKERNATVQFSGAVSLSLYVDPELAFMILRTLLENAIRYSPDGAHVEVCSEEKEGGTDVTVTDHGCGIPLSLQRLVFTKFFRSPEAKTLWTEGTGLSLHIAESIAKRTGESLSFVSEEGKGTTFIWHIPKHRVGRQPWEGKASGE